MQNGRLMNFHRRQVCVPAGLECVPGFSLLFPAIKLSGRHDLRDFMVMETEA